MLLFVVIVAYPVATQCSRIRVLTVFSRIYKNPDYLLLIKWHAKMSSAEVYIVLSPPECDYIQLLWVTRTDGHLHNFAVLPARTLLNQVWIFSLHFNL